MIQKGPGLLQTLQMLQISLFAVPVLGLFILGLLILTKPVLIFHRRVLLLALLPLLLANPLALIEEYTVPEVRPALDWRLGLALAADLGLIIAGRWLFRGWLIYGLSEENIRETLKNWFIKHGWEPDFQPGTRNTWWGGKRQAQRLQISEDGQTFTFWLLGQGSEVRLEGETREVEKHLRQALPGLNQIETTYDFEEHLTGVLYLVLAIILAVMGWIFFFEPRLILIE